MDSLEKISDAELSLKIKHGDKDAYQELFIRYAPRIFNFANSYLKNKDEAEELLQNVFLKVWENHSSLNESKNIKAYIFKIAINAFYDYVKRKNIENAFIDFAKNNYEVKSNSTWQDVIYNEMVSNLNALVEKLPEQRRKIFRLSKEDGLTNDEIAHKLNLSKRTVENQLYRALSFLKEHFKEVSVVALLFFYIYCS